jgi:hypothetical protein
MTQELKTIFDQYFKFLTDDYGYTIDKSQYDAKAFGNFVIELSRGQKRIRITSDRLQVFVDIFIPKSGWVDKEDILERKGIKRTRFSITSGLWDGYEIQNQAQDIQDNRDLLDI